MKKLLVWLVLMVVPGIVWAHADFTATDGTTYVIAVPYDERPIVLEVGDVKHVGTVCADEVVTRLQTSRDCTWTGEVSVVDGTIIETAVAGHEVQVKWRAEKFWMILAVVFMAIGISLKIAVKSSTFPHGAIMIVVLACTLMAVMFSETNHQVSVGMFGLTVIAAVSVGLAAMIAEARSLIPHFSVSVSLHLILTTIFVVWA